TSADVLDPRAVGGLVALERTRRLCLLRSRATRPIAAAFHLSGGPYDHGVLHDESALHATARHREIPDRLLDQTQPLALLRLGRRLLRAHGFASSWLVGLLWRDAAARGLPS